MHDGVVEVIEVGEKQVRCIRLTKFNPKFVHPVHNIVREGEREDGPHLLDDESLSMEESFSFTDGSARTCPPVYPSQYGSAYRTS